MFIVTDLVSLNDSKLYDEERNELSKHPLYNKE